MKVTMKEKSLFFVTVATAMLLMTSCTVEEYTFNENSPIEQECITEGYEALEGEYVSENGSIVYFFNLNGTMGLRQDGILNGVSTYCFTPDGFYLKITNEFEQVQYTIYSIVDTSNVKGIVLDGIFYKTLN